MIPNTKIWTRLQIWDSNDNSIAVYLSQMKYKPSGATKFKL